MKAIIQTMFCLFFLISCNKKVEEAKTEKPKPILIKIGYYPIFHQPAETIFNLNENYLIFYSPTSYNPPPPPPPPENGITSSKVRDDYKEFLNERPELVPFKTNVSETEVQQILKITDSFRLEDFNDKDIMPDLDGMSTNIIIFYSDGKLIQMNPMNVPNPKQRELYNQILNIVLDKNSNSNNSIILQKIKDYR